MATGHEQKVDKKLVGLLPNKKYAPWWQDEALHQTKSLFLIASPKAVRPPRVTTVVWEQDLSAWVISLRGRTVCGRPVAILVHHRLCCDVLEPDQLHYRCLALPRP